MNLHAGGAQSERQAGALLAVLSGSRADAGGRPPVSFRCTANRWAATARREGPGCGIVPRRRTCPHGRVAARRGDRRALRRVRFTGPEIAECLGMPLSTVSGILTRTGMGSSDVSVLSRQSATGVSGRVS